MRRSRDPAAASARSCRRFLLCALASCILLGAEAAVRFDYGAGGTLVAPGLTGGVIVYGEGWSGTVSGMDGFRLPDPETGRVKWSAKGGKGLSVTARVEAREAEDGIAVRVTVVSGADAKPECVAYAFNLKAAEHVGWTWSADCAKGPKTGVIPSALGNLSLFQGLAESFSVISPDGSRGFVWKFPEPCSITFQDGRRWGSEISLRIGSRPAEFTKGTKIKMAFTLSARGGQTLRTACPCVISAGKEWIPVDYRKNVVPGSALDFSSFGFLDAPAGKHGWLRNVNGCFEFEGEPGVKRRFYGVNLCFSANVPDHALADELVDRLARMGYNTIRIHHYERNISRPHKEKESCIDPEKIERLDYLIAKGIGKGFYFTTDLYVSRTVRWEDIGLSERGRGQAIDPQHYKALVALWDPAFEDWKRFAQEFLDHVNSHTGRAYKDEPALPLISLVNEGQLTMGWGRGVQDDPIVDRAYRAWLSERRATDPSYRPEAPDCIARLGYYGETGAVMADFMADVERRHATRMKDFLRSIGVKALLTNANCGPHPASMVAVRGGIYDYTDDHFYVDHPQFLETRWCLPSRCPNCNPILQGAPVPARNSFTRVAGQPMCITEWNFSAPGAYRGIGGILTGAHAALQDWSGVWRFAYSHSVDGLRADAIETAGYFNVASDVLGLMSDKASICLFLRGDLPCLPQAYAFVADEAVIAESGPKPLNCCPPGWSEAAWNVRVAVTAPGREVPRGMCRLGMSDAYLRKNAPFPLSENPAFRLNRDSGTFVVDTPRTAGGFAPTGGLDCGRVAFEVSGAPATVWASSIDLMAPDLSQADRIVVFHLTDVQSEGRRYADAAKTILLDWGKVPSLARAGSARISLRLEKSGDYEVWALRTDGSRIEKVPATATDGRLSFEASVRGSEGARMAYEVVRRTRFKAN